MNAPLTTAAPWSADEFAAQLRARESRHLIHHPFNLRLNRGELAYPDDLAQELRT